MDNNAADPKQALVDKLKQSTNILVTVSTNPSVDQLAACLGLTLWLNKIDKHATAVFSGAVPSTIEFLQPEDTLEKTTDSLRDFIIALDKSKADKLRYKVEDTVVKIFITPYRTNLSADDLEFSQGDFNVDMVIAMGVHAQQDLDNAITAHGRILHDATVATITTGQQASELGSISWHDSQASSLSELVVELGNLIDQKQLDNQISTALLTGIVAETARFSNEKTTPQTMSISAQLMSAGANQQLVASKLEEAVAAPSNPVNDSEPAGSPDGTLEISHPDGEEPAQDQPDQLLPPTNAQPEASPPTEFTPETAAPEVTDVKTNGSEPNTVDQPALVDNTDGDRNSRLITEPPTMGGTLTANSRPDDVMLEPTSDPLSQGTANADQPLLDRTSEPTASTPPPEPTDMQPAPPSWMPPQPWMNQPATPPADAYDKETLADIEREVGSAHVQADGMNASEQSPNTDVSSARDEVMKAIDSAPDPAPEPIQALNAQPIDLGTPPAETGAALTPSTVFDPTTFGITNDPDPDVAAAVPQSEVAGPVDQPFTLPVPGALAPPPANPVPPTSASDKPAPPPVPPPMTNL